MLKNQFYQFYFLFDFYTLFFFFIRFEISDVLVTRKLHTHARNYFDDGRKTRTQPDERKCPNWLTRKTTRWFNDTSSSTTERKTHTRENVRNRWENARVIVFRENIRKNNKGDRRRVRGRRTFVAGACAIWTKAKKKESQTVNAVARCRRSMWNGMEKMEGIFSLWLGATYFAWCGE